MADYEIQPERDVCLIHNLEYSSPLMLLEGNRSDCMGATFWAQEPRTPQRTRCHGLKISKDTPSPCHAVSGTTFRKAMQVASRQGSWSSLMIYCLCQSLLLRCRRSQPWEKSLQAAPAQAALAQAASSPNCSTGCIWMAWGKVQPWEATPAPANPRQPLTQSG